MAVTLILNNSSYRNCSLSLENGPLDFPSTKQSYFKFYQFKVKRAKMESQLRQEQTIQTDKTKSFKQTGRKKRSCRDYMIQVREKLQNQTDLMNETKVDEGQRRSSSTMSIVNQRNKDFITATIKSTSTSTINLIANESKQKIYSKIRKAPLPLKNSNSNRPMVSTKQIIQDKTIPEQTVYEFGTVVEEDDDIQLSRPYGHVYKEVTSSSSMKIEAKENLQSMRQSILHSLMLHLNDHPPKETSKWDIYRDYGDKISASISDTMYRNFERVAL